MLLNWWLRHVEPCAGTAAETKYPPARLSMSNFGVTWSRSMPDRAAWREHRAALGWGRVNDPLCWGWRDAG
jgi:hypothetical protein